MKCRLSLQLSTAFIVLAGVSGIYGASIHLSAPSPPTEQVAINSVAIEFVETQAKVSSISRRSSTTAKHATLRLQFTTPHYNQTSHGAANRTQSLRQHDIYLHLKQSLFVKQTTKYSTTNQFLEKEPATYTSADNTATITLGK